MEDEGKKKAQLLKELTKLQRHNAALEKENLHYKNLANNQTEKKLRRLTAELAILTKLNDAVNRGASLNQIIRFLSQEVKKSFSCRGATVLLLNEEQNRLLLQKATLGPALTKGLEKLMGIKIPKVELPLHDSGYYTQVLKSGKPRLLTNSESLRDIIIEYIEASDFSDERNRTNMRKLVPQIQSLLGLKSAISVPLISKDEPIGVLDIFTKGTFNESDVEWTNRIAVQFVSIIRRKQLENELKREDKLLKDTQKISKVGGWEFDVVSRKGKMTEMTYQIHQIPVGQEMSMEDGMQFYHESGRTQIKEAFNLLLQEGKAYDFELPFVTAKGKKRWVRTTAKAEKKGGKVIRVFGNLVDITETRRAKDAVIESEKRYHQLFENSPVPLWEEDFTAIFSYFEQLKKSGVRDVHKYIDENPHTVKKCIRKIKVLDVNKAVLELYQAGTKKELFGNLGKLFSTGPFHVFKNEILAFARGEKEFVTEAVVQTLTGEERHILLKISVEGNSSTNEITYRGLVSTVDITNRVNMENAMAEREQRLQKAQRVARMGFLDWNLKTNKIFLSDEVYELYGLINEGKWKMPDFVAQVVHPDDLKFVQRELDLAVRGKKQYNIDHRVVRPDGEVIWVNAQAELARDETGAPRTLLGTVVDITARKRVEETLSQSETKYRQLVELAQEGIWTIDKDGNTTFVNPSMAKMLGYTAEEMTGKHLFSFMGEREVENALRNMSRREKGIAEQHDFEFLRKDGTKIYAAMATAPLFDDDGQYAGAIAGVIDITGKKQAEDALRLSEERFRLAFQISPDSINISRMEDGMYVNINDGFTALTGYTHKDAIGKTSLQINIWDDPKDRARLVEGLEKNGCVNNLEAKFRMKDGRVTTALVSATIIMLNKVPHILSITRSIEELKQAEIELKESEQRFRAIIDQAGDAMFLLDQDGKIIDVNIMACKSLGYSREELLAKTVADIDPEFISMDHRNRFWSRFAPGKITSLTSVHIRKDGTTFPVEIRAGLLHIKGQGMVLGFARDITERKNAETALQLEKSKAEKYLNVVGVMVLVLDKEGNVSLINNKGCEILGYSREQIIGKNWFDNFLPRSIAGQIKTMYNKMIAGEVQEDNYFENSLRTKNGKERQIAWHNVLLRNEKGKPSGILSAGTDITERLQVESELARHREQLQALSAHLQSIREEERAYIAQEMHDELGQRLTILKMDAAMLMKKLSAKAPLHKKMQSMLSLLDDTIHVVQKLASDLKPSILEEFGLAAAIKQQMKDFKKHSDIKYNLKIDIQEDPPYPKKLAIAIFRILQESLTNVLRHAHATEVKIEMSHTNGNLLMKIQDNGIGVPPEKLSDPASFGINGMRERMHPWGGKVQIKSAPEKGTTIVVTVPREKQEKTLDD